MSSSSVSYPAAAPWRGAAAAAPGLERAPAPVTRLRIGRVPLRLVLGATGLLALWIVMWSFFILGVVAPAAQLHRASANPNPTATATATRD